jgi:hypothetical protein
VLIIAVVITTMMVRAYWCVNIYKPLFSELLRHFQDVLDEARVDWVRVCVCVCVGERVG